MSGSVASGHSGLYEHSHHVRIPTGHSDDHGYAASLGERSASREYKHSFDHHPSQRPVRPESLGGRSNPGTSVSRATSREVVELNEQLAAQQRELDALRAQVAAPQWQQHPTSLSPLEQMQQQYNLQLQQMRQQISKLSGSGANNDSDNYTNQGAEDWIVDAAIESSFSQTHLWWNTLANR